MKKYTREMLEKVGFKERIHLGLVSPIFYLALPLGQGDDQDLYRLRWHYDKPEEFYVDIYVRKLMAWVTISEEDFLINTNGLSTSAVNHYKEIMRELEDEII